MELAELIGAAIAGGVVSSLINAIAGRGKEKAETTKAKAEASKVLADATETLFNPLIERLNTLEIEVKALKRLLDRYAKRVIYLMAGIETLIKQIKAKGDSPCWSPDEWNPEEDSNDAGPG